MDVIVSYIRFSGCRESLGGDEGGSQSATVKGHKARGDIG